MTDAELEQLGINVIRGLAMDAPERANSGHPGTAMALAPLAHVLFTRVMRHDPTDPDWPDRDRFVLSCGHASILLYSMLYLTGYGLDAATTSSSSASGAAAPRATPRCTCTAGVEVTTGPLGQGVGNGVGMGLAERWLRARFGPEVVDHYTFVICSRRRPRWRGSATRPPRSPATSASAGWSYVYDDNHITIDGPTELAYSDDVPARFAAYGWHAEAIGEVANDTAALEAALRRAMAVQDKPSMIVLRSHIGWPAPDKMDTAKAHGDPLGDDEIAKTKAILGLPVDETFWVPDDVVALYRRCIPRGQEQRAAWQARFDAWEGDKVAWDACQRGCGLHGWSRSCRRSSRAPRWRPAGPSTPASTPPRT